MAIANSHQVASPAAAMASDDVCLPPRPSIRRSKTT